MNFSRREFLAALAAGGAVIAGELWIPGQKTIFIPSNLKIWTFADSLVDRQYGYNEKHDYSWGRHVRRLRNGDFWNELIRMSSVDVTSNEMAAADMVRRLEDAYMRHIL